MLPLSQSFSGNLESMATSAGPSRSPVPPRSPDSPWRRFPSMLHNSASRTRFNFQSQGKEKAGRSISQGFEGPRSPNLLSPASAGPPFLAPPSVAERFVRSVSCEMGDIGGRPIEPIGLTSLMKFKVQQSNAMQSYSVDAYQSNS